MDLEPLPEALRIAAVVPARNAATTLPITVEALRSQPVEEIAVAVAPSDDGTVEVARRLARADDRIVVVDNPDGTTPAGLNRALAATSGEVVVRCDAHAVLPDGYVDRAVAVLAETGAANVGGRQVPRGETTREQIVAAAMRSVAGSGGAAYRVGTRAGPVDTVYLGVFRRSALEHVGGFDERLARNQDYELNIRLREAGGVVWFDPELQVGYRPRGTLRALARQYLDYGRYKQRVVWLHPRSLRPRQVVAPLLVVLLLAGLGLGVATGQWVPVIALAVAYALGVAVAAALAAPQWWLAPAVAAALAVMHLSWGAGFLLGPRRVGRPNNENRDG